MINTSEHVLSSLYSDSYPHTPRKKIERVDIDILSLGSGIMGKI